MNLYAFIFYLLALAVVAGTALAITRRSAVHAVIYLILSFVAMALLFYLLGAPFLAVLEVIVYAGAIMVLFLFIVMMLQPSSADRTRWTNLRQWLPALVLGGVCLGAAGVIVFSDPGGRLPLQTAAAGSREFGRFVFQKYWLAVEIASFLLLIALVGALYLGRREDQPREEPTEETP